MLTRPHCLSPSHSAKHISGEQPPVLTIGMTPCPTHARLARSVKLALGRRRARRATLADVRVS